MVADRYFNSFNIFGEVYMPSFDETLNPSRERILIAATILFAEKGYAAVSLDDIAKAADMPVTALERQFGSREALWKEALDRCRELYILYIQDVDKKLEQAASFEEVLDRLLYEPKRLVNVFTCYVFSLVQAEQFNNTYAGELFRETFLGYTIEFVEKWFKRCIERNMVAAFDSRTAATMFVNCVLIGLDVGAHQCLGRMPPYDPSMMFSMMQQFFLYATKADCPTAAKQS